MYQHCDNKHTHIKLPVGKVVCVGRNYLDHIQELDNSVPEQALLFIKPATSLCSMEQPLQLPKGQGECHNEIEIAVLIQHELCRVERPQQVKEAIWGVGIGLDLTLREVQTKLKQQGLPWERAKGFDNACPMSGFVPFDQADNLQDLFFSLTIDNTMRQSGHSKLMMRDVVSLVMEISQTFTLLPGDIVMTGTPKGVGPLHSGEVLEICLADHLTITTRVA